jgi:hypothetical protein
MDPGMTRAGRVEGVVTPDAGHALWAPSGKGVWDFFSQF